MKEQTITDITQFLHTLDESQLMYILAFIEKMFGSN